MKRKSQGFTLAELAIVTVVMGLLLGSLLLTLSTQLDQRKRNETQVTLDLARDALIGYAIANGRLPCPAAPDATGSEVPLGGATSGTPCTYSFNGFYPGTTVGISPVDAQGYLLDAWNNRIRYVVTNTQSNLFATSGQIKSTGIPNITPPSTTPYIYVCSSAYSDPVAQTGLMTTGASAACASTATTLTFGALAVIYSLGRNWATGGTSADESKNLDNDRAFVSHDPTEIGVTNEFDDLATWLSPSVLYNRMVAAGAI